MTRTVNTTWIIFLRCYPALTILNAQCRGSVEAEKIISLLEIKNLAKSASNVQPSSFCRNLYAWPQPGQKLYQPKIQLPLGAGTEI